MGRIMMMVAMVHGPLYTPWGHIASYPMGV